MTALVEATEMVFRRPGGYVLRIPSFSISAGEAVAVLGASGSGKSTLLDLVGGVVRPTSGSLSLFEQSTLDLSYRALDRLRGENVGVIFQEHNLLPFATVYQNVALGVQFSRVRRERVTAPSLSEEITRLLRAMDLDANSLMHRPAHTLSVGQRQRVAAARALLGQPPLIIADEPTSALDEGNQSRFMTLLQEARRSSGAALLFVTHDARLIDGFDQIIRLDDPAPMEREDP